MQMKKHIVHGLRLTLLLACLAFVFTFVFDKPKASATLPKDLNGHKVESLADGKLVDLGALSKGKPFYLVFSTPT